MTKIYYGIFIVLALTVCGVGAYYIFSVINKPIEQTNSEDKDTINQNIGKYQLEISIPKS